MEPVPQPSTAGTNGRYLVQSVLGEGGMAVVYRALDRSTQTEIALKRARFPPGADTAVLTSLFQREFHILSQLSHPSVIQVHDYGFDEEGPYYTMELLDGADVRDARRLGVREVCRILRDVASSLSVLHSRKLIHRDVSPRNVRRTASGRAKLLDFGAMMPMGLAKTVVGTPPCVPPEALQLQGLDGRADLFSLGVLAYWMLTGAYPYPARSLGELRDLWRSAIPAPHEIAPDVPPALSQLVRELLAIDRASRPATAADVMERLGALAGLEPEPGDQVARAYLTTPTLVGRYHVLEAARQSVLGTLDGRSAVLVIAGEPGSGRTRALDACVLEAKLAGLTVLRADASDAKTGDYGVVQVLARELLAALPDVARRAATPQRVVLGRVIEELRNRSDEIRLVVRRTFQLAARDFFLTVARTHRLMLAVDDVDRIDEPSAALLAAIAQEARRRGLLLAVTRESSEGSLRALELLEQPASRLDLPLLTEQETEAVLRSIFGDADHVFGLARRVFGISRGNPRDVLELARHLVDQGLARYEAGSWLLPGDAVTSNLPSSLEAAFEVRARELDPDARELAQALAIGDPMLVAVEAYSSLTEARDPGRAFAALASLIAAGILVPEGDRYRFAHQAWASSLERTLDTERKRTVHGRFARVLEHHADPLVRHHHLMESGQEALAIDDLVARIGTDALDYSSRTLALLVRAIEASAALVLPQQTRMIIELRVASISGLVPDYETFSRFAFPMLERLTRDSGLTDWAELGDDLPAEERLQRALVQAHARWEATPEAERGFSPIESMKRLCRLYSGFAAMAGAASEPDLLVGLPSLEPFALLSPAPLVIQRLVDGERAIEEGHLPEARAHFAAVIERVAEPDGAGLEPSIRDEIRHALTFVVGAIDAPYGLASALETCAALETVPRHRVNAWRIRRSYHRFRGEVARAKECQRRIELLELQDGVQPLQSGRFRSELAACWLSDDLIGLKNLFDGIHTQVKQFPRLRALESVAHAHYHKLRGEPERAMAELAPALELTRPARHVDWQYVAALEIELLTLLGRPVEAVGRAEEHLAVCRSERLLRAERSIEGAALRALLAAGRTDEAKDRADALIAAWERDGITSVVLTHAYETRARIALALGDGEGFRKWAGLCLEHFVRTDNPALRRRYEALVREASLTGVLPMQPGAEQSHTVVDRPAALSVLARLRDCGSATERARIGLGLLLENGDAARGFLFGVRGGVLELMASQPEAAPPAALEEALQALVVEELRTRIATLGESDATVVTRGPREQIVQLGYEPLLVMADRDGDLAIVAAAAIAPGPEGVDHSARAAIVHALGDCLLENADVDPVTRLL